MNFLVNTELTVNKNLLRTDFIKNWNDIVVAGGHIIAAIKNNEEASLSGDIDIFFIGKELTKEKVIQKIKNIYEWVTDFYEQKPTIWLTDDNVTFMLNGNKIQIITRRTFDTTSELLNSFDLDCCRFAFDGKSIITVKRGSEFLVNNKVIVFGTNDIKLLYKLSNVDRYKAIKLSNRISKYQKRYQIEVEYTDVPHEGLHQFNYDSVHPEIHSKFGFPGKEISYREYIELLDSDKLLIL